MNIPGRESAVLTPINQALVDALMESEYPARRAAATPPGAALAAVLPEILTRDYLATFCCTESGARRVLGLTLAFARSAESPVLAAPAFSLAAWAALALGHRDRAHVLVQRALAADEHYSLAVLVAEALYVHDLPPDAYRHASAATLERLARA